MSRALLLVSCLAAFGTAVAGIALMLLPDATMGVIDHELEQLPQAMGARYLFFSFMLAFALFLRRAEFLAGLYAGFALVAALDTLVYLHINPWPHAIALLGCLAVAALYLRENRA